MAYMRFHISSLNDTVDDVEFANYLDVYSKGDATFHVLKNICTSTMFPSEVLLR